MVIWTALFRYSGSHGPRKRVDVLTQGDKDYPILKVMALVACGFRDV